MITVLRNIFSIKIQNNKHVIFTVLGIKLSVKLFSIIYFCSFIFDNLLRKDENKVVFNSEPEISDNPYCLYEYIKNNCSNIDCYWIVSDSNYTKPNIKNIYSLFSLKGLYHIFTAKYIVSNHCNDFVDIINSKKHVWLNLWHGMSMKTLGYSEKQIPKIILSRYKKLGQMSYQFVSSDLFRTIMTSCFCSEYNKCFITGLPRNDKIFDVSNDVLIQNSFKFSEYEKIILYVPTYKEMKRACTREVNKPFNNIFYMDDYEENVFLNYLKNNKILFLIKPHPFDEVFYKESVEEIYMNQSNIKFLYNNDLNKINIALYEIFKYVDLMISDFSSITYDYLMLDKPIIYLNNLEDEYNTNRGLILEDNYEILMPGQKVNNFRQLYSAIVDAILADSWKEERMVKIPLIHKYRDNKSAQRVYEVMKGL